MNRKIECQTKERRTIVGRGPTPEDGELAPDLEKVEVNFVFYDIDPGAHRNAYQMILTPEEAKAFSVGKIYTLTIE